MRAKFFEAIRLLLPKSRIFNISLERNLRNFFKAIAPLPEDLRQEIEHVYMDYFPATTRALAKWEEIFHTQFSTSVFTEEERRRILTIVWWMRYGNPSKLFMQNVLDQLFGERKVNVIENTPVGNVLQMVSSYFAYCGNEDTYCGGELAMCGYSDDSRDHPPTVLRNDTEGAYDIPDSADYWSTCFILGGDVSRDAEGRIISVGRVEVEQRWKKLLEFCVLTLKQVHMTAVLFIDYV